MDHSKQQAKSVFRCRTRRLRGDSGGRKEKGGSNTEIQILKLETNSGNQFWSVVRSVSCTRILGFLPAGQTILRVGRVGGGWRGWRSP